MCWLAKAASQVCLDGSEATRRTADNSHFIHHCSLGRFNVSRILLVSQDEPLTRTIAIALRGHDHEVSLTRKAAAVLSKMEGFRPEVVVVDLAVADPACCDVLGRKRVVAIPLIVLSGQLTSAERFAAFAAGADDYLSKPFAMRDLLTMIRAVERRLGFSAVHAERLLVTPDFTVDLGRGQVVSNGNPIHLTSTEWLLLELLLRHEGAEVTGQQLVAEVWGPDVVGESVAWRAGVAALRRKV